MNSLDRDLKFFKVVRNTGGETTSTDEKVVQKSSQIVVVVFQVLGMILRSSLMMNFVDLKILQGNDTGWTTDDKVKPFLNFCFYY